MKSYLNNRSQHVSLEAAKSRNLKVTCGVPQGSILGPLLFLIYINDMHKAFDKCLVHHFADDTNLLYANKDPKAIKKVVDIELNNLYIWLCANRLSLNVSKTEFIIFRPPRKPLPQRIVLSLNRNKIYESTKIKYLGLILDSRLTWKHHINELAKKLSRAVGMLYKIRHYCIPNVLRSLYFSIFNSHLSYGIPVWGNAKQIFLNKLIALQKKAIRAISFADFHEHTSPIFKDLNILKLKDMFELQVSNLMWDFDHGTLPPSLSRYFKRCNSMHNLNTRQAQHGKLYVKKCNTLTYGLNSFYVQGSKILNKLMDTDLYTKSRSKESFVKKIKIKLIESY